MQFYQIWASQEWKEEITQDLTWPIEVFGAVYTARAAWQKMSNKTTLPQPGDFVIAKAGHSIFHRFHAPKIFATKFKLFSHAARQAFERK